MAKVKMLYLDAEHQTVDVVSIKPDLQEYYRLINCEYVEMPERYIGGKLFNIICDEEGTFVANPIISAVDSLGNVMLVGNLLISNLTPDYSDVASLTDEDVNLIMEHIHTVPTMLHREGRLLVELEYE